MGSHKFTIYALYFQFSISSIQCLKMVSTTKICSMLIGLIKFVASDSNNCINFSYDIPQQDEFYKNQTN